MTKIAVLDDYQDRAAGFADWDRLGADVVFFTEHLEGEPLTAALADFDVVVAMRERTAFPQPVLAALPQLRLLVSTGTKNAAIDLNAARELGITVCGTGGGSQSTTELTWALLLAAVKRLPQQDRAMRAGGWQTQLAGDVRGRRLGLIGLGKLGRAMVPVANAFGLPVSAWSQNLSADQAAAVGVDFCPSLLELLHSSDIVSIHLRLSDRTRGLLGAGQLAEMRPGALLINTSRGPIVDEAALIDALTSGRINAALDVYDVEPLPADHPLTRLDNVVLTPHLGYASEETFRVYYAEVVEDIEAYRAGRPIRLLED